MTPVYSKGVSIFLRCCVGKLEEKERFWLLRREIMNPVIWAFDNRRESYSPPPTSEYWLPIFWKRSNCILGSREKLLSPGSTRPISYPGPFRIILSFLGSPRESSCCYRHPTGTFHHFLTSDPLDSPCSKSPGAVCEVPSWSWGSTLFLDPARRIVLTPGPGQFFFDIAMISMELLNNIIIIDLSWPWCPTPIWQNSATCTLRSWTAMLRIGPSISFHHNFQTFRKKWFYSTRREFSSPLLFPEKMNSKLLHRKVGFNTFLWKSGIITIEEDWLGP